MRGGSRETHLNASSGRVKGFFMSAALRHDQEQDFLLTHPVVMSLCKEAMFLFLCLQFHWAAAEAAASGVFQWEGTTEDVLDPNRNTIAGTQGVDCLAHDVRQTDFAVRTCADRRHRVICAPVAGEEKQDDGTCPLS